MLALECSSKRLLQEAAAHFASVRNLLHYLAFRRHDLRHLQKSLASVGVSSLGRAESCVLANVEAVVEILRRLLNEPSSEGMASALSSVEGKALLQRNTESLLGPVPDQRFVRVMVTMPSEAATHYELVRELVQSGMNCMRINCAHDGPDTWGKMIANLRRAERELAKRCQVAIDLAGPKLRTGALQPGPQVIKWRPHRDDLGTVVAPACIWLTPTEEPQVPPPTTTAVLPVARSWLALLNPGDRIDFTDARGATRWLDVSEKVGPSRRTTSDQTSYVTTGTILHHRRSAHCGEQSSFGTTPVGPLPPKVRPLFLNKGDRLLLTRDPSPGRPARLDNAGNVLRPATIPCTLPEVFADVRPGESVWLDDGKIGGIIHCVTPEEVEVKIICAPLKGAKLGADKGINLPNSDLHLPALTPADIDNLPFVAKHADMVGFSFVQRPEDVEELQRRLTQLGASHVGIVLKIETRRGFEQLPNLLLAVMRSERAGVMIARGDLAVECGYERLAEVQEEILWVCEAAHMPVIWATQVLESLAKAGQPSRAEITDAAMGERAECVMLNKGPHIVQAVEVLDNILQRMQAHQDKKRSKLRPLRLAEHLQHG
jgi:pyruvate kinase